MQPLIEPGDIITRSWQNLVGNKRLYAHFGIWFTLLSIGTWLLALITRNLIEADLTRGAVTVLLNLPLTLLVMALGAAIIDATAKVVQGKAMDERQSLSIGLHMLIPFLWVSVLTGLAMTAGLIMLIVPFFIFLVWFRFSQNIVVVEGIRGTAALRASKRLSAGRWGAVFSRIALPGIFFYVLSMFVTSVLNLAIGFAMGDPGMFFANSSTTISQMTDAQLFVSTVVPSAVNAFLTLPLLTAADVLLWLDLKRTSGA